MATSSGDLHCDNAPPRPHLNAVPVDREVLAIRKLDLLGTPPFQRSNMQTNPRIAPAKPALTSDEGDTCLYPSKRCENPRALKENGQLHSFCELHRRKANLNQRRTEHKRRALLEQSGVNQTPSPGVLVPFQPPPAQSKDDASEALSENKLDLDEEEIRVLLELLSASSEESKSD